MKSLKRSFWTRNWLNTFPHQDTPLSHQDIDADYQFPDIDDPDASDFGVESLSDNSDQTEPSHIKLDTSIEPLQLLELPAKCFSPLSQSWIWDEHCNGDTNTRYEGENGLYNVDGLIDRKDVVDYELCGRRTDNAFRDFRSAAKSRKRRRCERNKYYDWKRVRPDWLGAQVHDICELSTDGCHCFNKHISNDQFTSVTKQMMFEEAKGYPRPPTYHRSTRKPHLRLARSWSRIERQKEDAKHARLRRLEEYYADLDYRRRFGVDGGPDDTRAILGDWWAHYELHDPEDIQHDAPEYLWTEANVDTSPCSDHDEQRTDHENLECRREVVPKTVCISEEYAGRNGCARRATKKYSKFAHLHLMYELDDWSYMDDVDEYLEVYVLPYVFREDAWEYGL